MPRAARAASTIPPALLALIRCPLTIRPWMRISSGAVCALMPAARAELFVLMRMGQGDLAVLDWDRGLTEAALLGEDAAFAALTEDPDLHEHLSKALYELGTQSARVDMRQTLLFSGAVH